MQRTVWIMRRTLTEDTAGRFLRIEFSEADPNAQNSGPVGMGMPVYSVTVENPSDADMAAYVRGAKFVIGVTPAA